MVIKSILKNPFGDVNIDTIILRISTGKSYKKVHSNDKRNKNNQKDTDSLVVLVNPCIFYLLPAHSQRISNNLI